jgi:hypothetical protein
MQDLVGVGMPAQKARLLGSDGQNGAKIVELAGVGFSMAQAKLLATDAPGTKPPPMALLIRAGMPAPQAMRLGV